MGGIISAILGGGESPTVSSTPVTDTEGDAKKAKKSRVALTQTQGGVGGTELNTGEVGGSDTLFGN